MSLSVVIAPVSLGNAHFAGHAGVFDSAAAFARNGEPSTDVSHVDSAGTVVVDQDVAANVLRGNRARSVLANPQRACDAGHGDRARVVLDLDVALNVPGDD